MINIDAKTALKIIRINSFLKTILLLPLHFFYQICQAYSNLLNFIKPGLGLAFFDEQLRSIYSIKKIVQHRLKDKVISLQIHTPNSLCGYRADTFSTKEPETLAWIDEFGGNGPLFDIGANIGLYSLYYASTKPGNVYSFEPSVLNLKLLAKNIHTNNLEKKIRIIPNPITDNNNFADFSLSSIDEGGALSSFGVKFGHNGEPLDTKFSYQTLGFTLDYLLSENLIKESPQLIKIDVDGIEHLILGGAINILKNPSLKSLLIEVNDDYKLQAIGVSELLISSGFYLKEKRHSEIIAAGNFSKTFNQIWCKNKGNHYSN